MWSPVETECDWFSDRETENVELRPGCNAGDLNRQPWIGVVKISTISMYQLAINFHDISYKMADGRTYSAVDSTIVRIRTDAGLEGWGEICPWGPTYLPEFAEGARAAITLLAPHLLGADPTNVGEVYNILNRELPGHFYAKSALDLACWDILGKACNKPVYALLGGHLVNEVPLASAIFNGPAEQMIGRINTRRAEGYRHFSTKPSGEPVRDIRLYGTIADQMAEGELYIADANQSWSLLDTLKIVPHLERLGYLIEQPCETYSECLKVRRMCSIPMILDELIIEGDDLALISRDNAADVVQLKVSRIGGLTPAKRMLDFCLIAGLSVIWATSGGSEISDAAVTQLALATPKQRCVAIWSCREFSPNDRFAAGGPIAKGGRATMPELLNPDFPEPQSYGLGVQPDIDRLGRPIAEFGIS